jgi:hypothetical protein
VKYNIQIIDSYGNPLRHDFKSGTFTFKYKTTNCTYDDGSSKTLSLKKIDGHCAIRNPLTVPGFIIEIELN